MEMCIAWIVLAALAVVTAVVISRLVGRPMGTMLESNSYMAPARGFYVRAFGLSLALSALATITGRSLPCPDQRRSMAAMEYVWWVVGGLSSAFWASALFLIGYVVLLTILYAVLGRYREADSVLKCTAGEKMASQGLFGRLLLSDKSHGQETLRCTDGILHWRSGSF
jgi:hypothetical protein